MAGEDDSWQRPRVHADGSGANSRRADGAALVVYRVRSQSAVVVENACVEATRSKAVSDREGQTTSRLSFQRALRVANLAS
jgi:hypothetical protein